MTSRGSWWLAWTLGVLTCAVAIALLTLHILDPTGQASAPNSGGGMAATAFETLVLVTLAIIGSVVASRQPRNVVGWILCVIPLSLGVLILASGAYWSLRFHGVRPEAGPVIAAWFGTWIWVPAVIPTFTLFPLLYPTGRPPTPRWRPVVWMAVASCVLVLVSELIRPGRYQEFPVDNPTGVGGVDALIQPVGDVLWLITTILSIASLVVRFRRSVGVERQQIKWVVAAALIFVLMFAASSVIQNSFGHEDLGFAMILLGWLLIASAVAVAILRYRLYDIDVVINRALVYGSLTAMLAAVYLSSVLLMQLLLDRFTQGSGLAVAASTLATAMLVRPARARIQEAVDRRFFRRKYDAARTLEHFAARVRDEVDLDALTAELRAVVAQTMQPRHASLWTREVAP